MQFGIWCPLAHTIRSEERLAAAVADLATAGPPMPVANGEEPSADRMFAFAAETLRRAESLGFVTSLIAERWLGPDHSAWMMASALAAVTSRIELMVAVHPGIMQPQQVAKLAASLDRISGGRAALNIVNGWWEEEFALFSNGDSQSDPDSRYRRMDEYLDVLRGLWEVDPFDYHGEFYHVEHLGLPLKCVQRPSLPIYAGTRTAPGMDIIAAKGNCWFVSYEGDYRRYEENLERIRTDIALMRDKASGYGRRLSFGMSCHLICASSDEEAIAQAEAFEKEGLVDRLTFIAAKALGGGLIGSPHTIARRIRAYEEAGIDMLMLHFHPMIEGMEQFAREVMPLLEKADA